MKDSPIFFALKAEDFLKAGKIRKAIRTCKKGIRKYPEYQAAYVILSECYLAKKDKSRSLKHLKTVSRFYPHSKVLTNLKEKVRTSRKGLYFLIFKPAYLTLMIFFVVACSGIAIVPAVFPDFSSNFAERMRGFLGPVFVSRLEEISFEAEDYYNEVKLKMGDKQQIDFDVSINNASFFDSDTPSNTFHAIPIIKTANPDKFGTIDSVGSNLTLNDFNGGDWTEFFAYNGEPLFFRKKINPDETKPYCQVFFVKIPVDKISLNLAEKGKIPEQMQNDLLLAAFNGGFRHIHGGYGMKIDGDEIYPAKNNIGTLIIDKNGNADIIRWDNTINSRNDILSFRQNCPLILENGDLTKEISKNQAVWGFTIDNKVLTWRSGVGITKDKKYLIYGFGKSLNVVTLAKAFIMAGASNAMQLDINPGWTKFVVFDHSGQLIAKRIIKGAPVRKYEYLKSSENSSLGRDFFYLCYKKR